MVGVEVMEEKKTPMKYSAADIRGSRDAAVHSHADRPPSKTVLPFRVFRDQYTNDVVLECNATLPDGQLSPYRIILGPEPLAAHVELYNTIGRKIYDLLQLYWQLEDTVGGLMQERDAALGRVADLEGRLRTAEISAERKEGKLPGRPKGS